jgi:hypothetical protein
MGQSGHLEYLERKRGDRKLKVYSERYRGWAVSREYTGVARQRTAMEMGMNNNSII